MDQPENCRWKLEFMLRKVNFSSSVSRVLSLFRRNRSRRRRFVAPLSLANRAKRQMPNEILFKPIGWRVVDELDRESVTQAWKSWMKEYIKETVTLKKCSNWPTFPQMFLNDELVGGCDDIFTSMIEKATVLISVISVANAFSRNDFPPHFLFGASTSAYQVEGAAHEDGRKPSIWDTFAHSGNGGLYKGDGDIACDQYHKYKDDVQLMSKMGLDAYRFSISWSRLIPDGKGPINPKGLQYYNNLINELTRQGIQPHVTLYHWDLPQALEDEYGGWVSRRIIKDFTAYADICFREFGDRVKRWTTVNEGNVVSIGGYDAGILPPQRCSSPSIFNCSKGNSSIEPYLVTHHMLLAHASAARLYRTKYKVNRPVYDTCTHHFTLSFI
ncbi:hypothetical protein TSUD_263300 [Trifolium subterraneum]|uniref:Uncharacterized protein n=1 Tax=Trifolium subterraneum TaxID=3900 RepID=A0A2Z6PMC2_TRISU|nr:hypothetical protein TSUD_263300 [Trifolium subterraneum]